MTKIATSVESVQGGRLLHGGMKGASGTSRQVVAKLKRRARLALLNLAWPTRLIFRCPICDYYGQMLDVSAATGTNRRMHAICPSCGALERHRLQWLVLRSVIATRRNLSNMKVLHIAPEAWAAQRFSKLFDIYHTADLVAPDVMYHADLTDMRDFEDESYDLVYASHVLEHIAAREDALRNIARLLRRDGCAILPVPIVAAETVYYPEPNPYDNGHVAAPGLDYYTQYRSFFSQVEVYSSFDFPDHQTFIFEDRTKWPTVEAPLRPSMPGQMHADYVPICWK